MRKQLRFMDIFMKQNIVWMIITIASVFCLKYHYSHASSDELMWILKPTAILVEHVTDIPFICETNTGFINRKHRIVIAPSCAGVNFLIMAFCMSSFTFLCQPGLRRLKPILLLICGCLSYLFTLLVNAIRIIVAIYLYNNDVSWGWFTPDRLHRIEGIAVYFICLYVFYIGLQNALNRVKKPNRYNMPIMIKIKNWIPLMWYLSIALGIPVLNASYMNDFSKFMEHFLTVIIVSAILIIMGIQIKKMIVNDEGNKTSEVTD